MLWLTRTSQEHLCAAEKVKQTNDQTKKQSNIETKFVFESSKVEKDSWNQHYSVCIKLTHLVVYSFVHLSRNEQITKYL